MNIMERDKGEAKLHYLDGEYEVVSPGGYVVCAVTGTQIPLDALAVLERRFAGGLCQPRMRRPRAPSKRGLIPK